MNIDIAKQSLKNMYGIMWYDGTYEILFKKGNVNKLIKNITQCYSMADKMFLENSKALSADYLNTRLVDLNMLILRTDRNTGIIYI